VKVKQIYTKSLFDRGFCSNLGHTLGHNPLLWCCPTKLGMPKDGTRFVTRDDLGDPFQRPERVRRPRYRLPAPSDKF
jgi:hypothetical protein